MSRDTIITILFVIWMERKSSSLFYYEVLKFDRRLEIIINVNVTQDEKRKKFTAKRIIQNDDVIKHLQNMTYHFSFGYSGVLFFYCQFVSFVSCICVWHIKHIKQQRNNNNNILGVTKKPRSSYTDPSH